jgi:hypothetical protein
LIGSSWRRDAALPRRRCAKTHGGADDLTYGLGDLRIVLVVLPAWLLIRRRPIRPRAGLILLPCRRLRRLIGSGRILLLRLQPQYSLSDEKANCPFA